MVMTNLSHGDGDPCQRSDVSFRDCGFSRDRKPLTSFEEKDIAKYRNRKSWIWDYILSEINYWPIFKIASDILLPIRDRIAIKILKSLFKSAYGLISLGVASQHDLCGRMFQRLITDRKFLATFYTLPSSAALLAELAVSRLSIDWSNRERSRDYGLAISLVVPERC